MKGIESFLKRGSNEIENHLTKLIVNSEGFYDSLFQIIILWSDGKDIMTDIWLYKGIESEDTGYTIDCRTYRDFSEVHEAGISASDGIVLIGKETELAEDYRKEKNLLKIIYMEIGLILEISMYFKKLARSDDFRTIDWVKVLKYPEFVDS
ncbi:hypothetical protein H6763_00295 [Candidatus Nomurabacteria bacterium]|nr:hypothetical protein [Candidatus Nomurabacteria bacterium]MCB9803255.1 hypothetical protein [Candidatus Nomurabacteria bacterium]